MRFVVTNQTKHHANTLKLVVKHSNDRTGKRLFCGMGEDGVQGVRREAAFPREQKKH